MDASTEVLARLGGLLALRVQLPKDRALAGVRVIRVRAERPPGPCEPWLVVVRSGSEEHRVAMLTEEVDWWWTPKTRYIDHEAFEVGDAQPGEVVEVEVQARDGSVVPASHGEILLRVRPERLERLDSVLWEVDMVR